MIPPAIRRPDLVVLMQSALDSRRQRPKPVSDPPAEGVYCACHSRIAFNGIPAKGPKSAAELERSLRRYA